MFNRLKKRVKDVQDNHRTKTRNHQQQQPNYQYNHDSSDSNLRTTTSSSATDVAYSLASSAKVALEKQAIRSKANVRTSHHLTDETPDHFVDPLSRFHGCIEATDALACDAGSRMMSMPARLDGASGLADCSVLVSPDGDLLLVPQGEDQRNLLLKRRQSKLASSSDKGDTETKSGEGVVNEGTAASSSSQSMFTELMLNGKDDYESAVFMGYDLHPEGDKALNGFSARGWSIPATTAALQQTEQSLHDLTQFCEDMVLSQKEFAAKASVYCDNLRVNHPSLGGHAPQVHPVDSDWEIVDPRASDFIMTPGRVGPLLYPGSTLCQAVMALENYYSRTAEGESQRWRMASLQRKGFLPSIRRAYQQFVERSKKRQQALDGASQQARRMEDRLNRLKILSERSWEAVYDAEHRVSTRIEDLLTERSRAKELERMEKLKVEEEKRQTDSKDGSLGTTTEEIWSIVSQVAESMEDGSFEPMDLPSAPFSVPTDKSKEENADEQSGNDADGTSQGMDSLPIASREQIESELGLHELRSTAMAADEAVADAADALMNMLSNLDTTRRSAKVAAETNLISACNAQASCVRSLVKLERASLEERLKGLNEVEQLLDRIEPRKDLDQYIKIDKQECGGSSHLGEDDDGGIAAALAILSRHVEGSQGLSSRSTNSDINLAGSGDSDAATERIEAAIDGIVNANERLDSNVAESGETTETRADFDKSIDFLCKAAMEMGTSGRAKRSKICYALNAKRGSNAEIPSAMQFDGLCRVFRAILSGCGNEDGSTANAKMCIMLASTFYLADAENPQAGGNGNGNRSSRDHREFVRTRLRDHPLWKREDFWDATFGQLITESLTHSGVMANFEKDKSSSQNSGTSEWLQHRKTHWYDLTQMERVDAAAQVHAVVFAQLGALAHSMIEMGCGLERSAAFVRRMSIRNQLPISQRTMLLQHLMSRDGIERLEDSAEKLAITEDSAETLAVTVNESNEGSVNYSEEGENDNAE
ncbi:hypothetical protein MPSEU_001087700 [Mayamaea pseudoterrestris]|nr:hypothetical protein MPSEU_001087700 [Mayamaea pseudoterrestris]